MMATLGKPQRQHRIARLLEEQPVSSQAQLVELLAAEGVVATQATVSRDLEDLGAVKVRVPGGDDGLRHPRAADGAASRPTTTCAGCWASSWSRSRTAANLVVLRTPPGSRARRGVGARPRRRSPDVLGTVAGDDTMLVVVAGDGRRRQAVAAAEPRRALAGL